MIAANAAILDTVTPSGRLRLADTFDPATALVRTLRHPRGGTRSARSTAAPPRIHRAAAARLAAALGHRHGRRLGTDRDGPRVVERTRRWHVHSTADRSDRSSRWSTPLCRCRVLFGATEFDAAAVAFVRANPKSVRDHPLHHPRHAGDTPPDHLRQIRQGRRADGVRDDGGTTRRSRPPRTCLATFDPVTKFAATDRGRLAATVRVEASRRGNVAAEPAACPTTLPTRWRRSQRPRTWPASSAWARTLWRWLTSARCTANCTAPPRPCSLRSAPSIRPKATSPPSSSRMEDAIARAAPRRRSPTTCISSIQPEFATLERAVRALPDRRGGRRLRAHVAGGRGDLERPAVRAPGADEPRSRTAATRRTRNTSRYLRRRSRPTSGTGGRTTGSGRPTARSSCGRRTTSSPSCATTRRRCSTSSSRRCCSRTIDEQNVARRLRRLPRRLRGAVAACNRRRLPRQGPGERTDVLHLFGVDAGRPADLLLPHRRERAVRRDRTGPRRRLGAVAADRRADPGPQGRAGGPPRPAVRLLDRGHHHAEQQGLAAAARSSSATSTGWR